MKNLITTFSIAMILSGCVHKQLIMSAGAVSMTKSNSPAKAKIKSLGPVEAKYCPKSFASSSGKEIGVIDEAVKAAQKKSNADAIRDVKIYHDGECYSVEGEGVSF